MLILERRISKKKSSNYNTRFRKLPRIIIGNQLAIDEKTDEWKIKVLK